MKTIYKFRDWQSPLHKRILTHQEVYLAPPSSLNDPSDCRIMPDYSLLKNSEDIEEYAKKSLAFIDDMPKPVDYTYEKIFKKIVNSLTNNREETQKQHDRQHKEMQDEWYGIFSTSKQWNILLLWVNYANNHSGFCVGFNLEKFRYDQRFGKAGPVKYKSKFPRINPLTMFDEDMRMENSFIETFTKSTAWRYEKEFRLFKTSDCYTNDSRKIKVDKSYFTDITLGEQMANNDKNEIIQLANQLNIRKVYQSYFKRNDFKLSRRLIKV